MNITLALLFSSRKEQLVDLKQRSTTSNFKPLRETTKVKTRHTASTETSRNRITERRVETTRHTRPLRGIDKNTKSPEKTKSPPHTRKKSPNSHEVLESTSSSTKKSSQKHSVAPLCSPPPGAAATRSLISPKSNHDRGTLHKHASHPLLPSRAACGRPGWSWIDH